MEYLQHPPGRPTYVPELIFVDRNRVIRAQYTGNDDFFKDQDKNIRALVETLVKETAAPKKSGSRARKTPSQPASELLGFSFAMRCRDRSACFHPFQVLAECRSIRASNLFSVAFEFRFKFPER